MVVDVCTLCVCVSHVMCMHRSCVSAPVSAGSGALAQLGEECGKFLECGGGHLLVRRMLAHKGDEEL